MRIGGIVAEYNPFHRGHAYLAEAAREQGVTHLVAVMSGNFVQRGDAAVCDKWARCEMALESGVDLVLELPLPYAVATAQRFAFGAVGTLAALGSVNELCFGSESADTEALLRVAAMLEDEKVLGELHRRLDMGEPFAAARQAAVTLAGGRGELLSSPNDTLAVEYIRAIAEHNCGIKPLAVKRVGAAHDGDTVDGIASASKIREMLLSGELAQAMSLMPEKAAKTLKRELEAGGCPADLGRLEPALLAALRRASAEELALLPDVSEGLENRLYRAVRQCSSAEEILAAVKSKRYTHARLRRILLYVLLGVGRGLYSAPPAYIRVLGMNSRGREILAASRPTLPLLTRANDRRLLDEKGLAMLDLECAADDLYSLTLPVIRPCGETMTRGVVVK